MRKQEALGNAAARIRDAFADVCYPGNDNIVVKSFYPDRERANVVAYLSNKHWSRISAKEIRNEFRGDPTSLITDLSPEAFQYFLPGFIIMCLREFDVADVMVDSLAMKFHPLAGIDTGVDNQKIRRIAKLTAAQLKAVLHAFTVMELFYGKDSGLEQAIWYLTKETAST